MFFKGSLSKIKLNMELFLAKIITVLGALLIHNIKTHVLY